MNFRERISTVIAGESPDLVGFWPGKPHVDSRPSALRSTATEQRYTQQ